MAKIWVACCLLGMGLAGCYTIRGSTPVLFVFPAPNSSPVIPTAPPAPTPTPMMLSPGAIVGSPYFPPGNTSVGGQGAPVDGINCDNAAVGYHVHSHVSLFVSGTQLAIPLAIGLISPTYSDGGTVAGDGTCAYHLHTHDSSGIIHIENPAPTTFTLGQVFDIWGRPLSTSNVAGFAGPVLCYVGASLCSNDPRAIVLGDHEQITLEVGAPYVFPPFYTWPY